ncbi:MAG: DUF7482 domain-containing protein [Nitrososphaera sp.]|uniref:DUF7482 domain-containing protein n=1 Tax=Nitrososphaera sp. TaxID=1971748 RepID=UPI003D6EF30C
MNFDKNKRLPVFVIAAAILLAAVAATPYLQQPADAKHVSRILMTTTVQSEQATSPGHESHQIAMILSPNEGSMYTGIITWSASQPVEVFVLHNYNGNSTAAPARYQLGESEYALSLISTGADGKSTSAGSTQFVGNALALQNIEGDEFAATVSVDGLQRKPTLASVASPMQAPGSALNLSAASVPMDIPMVRAYENGSEIYIVATDASDRDLAAQLTNITGFKVNHAPLMAQTPDSARGQAYVFRNGVEGDGPLAFQVPVVNAKPGDEGYSPLLQVSFVDWNDGANATELKSVSEVMDAEQDGRLTITNTDIIVNHPAVKWQGGSLAIREDRDSINDDSPYMGGQVLEIGTGKMVATFVAHRGWGPDGKTVYYIVTDATPEMPATMMGVPSVAADEGLAATPVAVDLFQFMNGIKGSGPMGFQAGIGGANPDDGERYSPMWRISFIEWKKPGDARLLETTDDIAEMVESGAITVTPAMEGRHVVNCPFFDQQTVMEHRSDRS